MSHFPVSILSSAHKKNKVETCLTLLSFYYVYLLLFFIEITVSQISAACVCVVCCSNNKFNPLDFELWPFLKLIQILLVFIKAQSAFESIFWENSSISFWVISRFEYWSRAESGLIKFIPGLIPKLRTNFLPNLRATFWDKLVTCKHKNLKTSLCQLQNAYPTLGDANTVYWQKLANILELIYSLNNQQGFLFT